MGGIGKTQTALEYAYRYGEYYQYILWGNANSREELIADFSSFAKYLSLPEKNAEDQGLIASAVTRWFENNDGWLLILDNADDLEMVREFLPSNERGYILLTTRAQTTRPIATQQSVEKMGPQDGSLFLLRRIGEVRRGDSLELASEALRVQAEALSKEVDGLPLALDQAAAYIDETKISPEKYLILFQTERTELLALRGGFSASHPSVTVTFSLAFKKVEEASPSAADLLRICAFLEADGIPEEIFSKGAEELGDFLSLHATNPLRLNQVIAEAGRFSLLQRNPQVNTVSIHRLVQVVLKDEMSVELQREWVQRVIRALNRVFPDKVEYSNWPLCRRLIPHAQILATQVDRYGLEFSETAQMMNQAGDYLRARAQYNEAELLLKRALNVREKALGAEHPDTATSLNDLARVYREQGRYEKAEPLDERALVIREKVLGAQHPDTATSLNNLAVLYELQGRYEKAEPLYERALAIREKALGAEHPDTATSLNNLAELYQSQGRYEKAEPLFERALAICEKVIGAEHPDTARSLNNLATLYVQKGNKLKVEPLYKRALAIFEKTLGWEHPDLVNVLLSYAQLLRSMHRGFDASKLEARAKKIQGKRSSTKDKGKR